jgi:hypothetical protein
LDVATTTNHTVLAASTAEHDKSNCTDRDCSRAKLARQAQILVGYPELRDFLACVDENAILNCPIGRQDAINAQAMFGRAVGAMKGKTTRRELKAILAGAANSLPPEILDAHQNATLCIDLMFVNRIPFFISISQKIHFITAEAIDNRKQPSLESALKRIYGVCRKRGFRITMILGDSEFECLRGTIATDLRSELNVCAEDEHIPDIERCIRTTKERTRCHCNATPFDEHPPRMIVEMVFLGVFWLNAFPHKNGISKTLSPRAIVTGLGIDCTKHCRIQFGQHAQTHKKHDNAMTPRTIGAIALRPTGNQQGGHCFHGLMSGKRLHRTHWTELPMPAEAKDRIHALAWRAKAHRGLTFTDSNGNDLDALCPEEDDDADSDCDPDPDDSYDESTDSADASDDDASNVSTNSSDDDDNEEHDPDLTATPTAELAGVDAAETREDNTPPGVGDTPENNETPGVGEDDAGVDNETAGVENETAGVENDVDDTAGVESENENSEDSDHQPETDDCNSDEADNMNADAAREQTTADIVVEDVDSDEEESDDDIHDDNSPPRRLRRNRQPSYIHLKGRDGDGSSPTIARPEEFKGGRHQSHVILQSIIMTQCNLKQGIKKFGDDGEAAAMAELQQLHNRDVMEPVGKCELTLAERKGALRYLMFIKEKRDGLLKCRREITTRMCVERRNLITDGRDQGTVAILRN